MKKISAAVVAHRKTILILAMLLCVISFFLMQMVNLNYDLSSYLPADAPSTKALRLVGGDIPNLKVYLPGRSIVEAQAEKDKLASIPGVLSVLWLDDLADIGALPPDMIPGDVREPFYQGGPLYQIRLSEGTQGDTVTAIRARYPDALLSGPASDLAQQVNVTMKQIASIMYFVVPICLVILILTTTHWVEPVFFLIAIGFAILVNEGTNIFLGSISYVTRACAALLQLAVSIDYAIFLLHRFSESREKGLEPVEAMRAAMRQSASTISASALTTAFGFLALLFMDFTLGRDMGIVLVKGVLLSYLSVMIVLPAVAVSCVKCLDATRHRSFMFSFRRTGRAVVRYGAPLAVVLILLLPLAFIAQRNNSFLYGTGGMFGPASRIKQEQKMIEERFGRERTLLAMVPEGDFKKEQALSRDLRQLPGVLGVMSYVDTVSANIPRGAMNKAAVENFYQDGYARFILTAQTKDEGPEAFALVEAIRDILRTHYPKENHLAGESVTNYDLKQVITGDTLKVIAIGLVSIFMILVITFRGVFIPLVLLLIIEGSIWLNMGLPYVMGESLNYVGYLIVSSVQLGATVDYGILLCERYLEGRRTLPPRQAAARAISVSAGSIMSTAGILALAGYALFFAVRDNRVISEMGGIIGRGALISGVMVLLVLPNILVFRDSLKERYKRKRKEEA